jgi:hypothetical protein
MDIDLQRININDFVLHFGGRPREVDAFTFSNSLIAIGEALQEINRQLSPEFSIQITIDDIGPGSFRAKITTKLRSIGGLFKKPVYDLSIGILGAIIYTKLIAPVVDPDKPIQVIVNADNVVVKHGEDRVIIPKSVWDAKAKIPHPERVEKHISRVFSVLQDDPSITDFGILNDLSDTESTAIIPKSSFEVLAAPVIDDDEDSRVKDERTHLLVVRAILERSSRRWQFVWMGIKISASISDPEFFDKMESREYLFGQGDVLDVSLRIYQFRDSATGIYINGGYEVIRVHGVSPRAKQARLG